MSDTADSIFNLELFHEPPCTYHYHLALRFCSPFQRSSHYHHTHMLGVRRSSYFTVDGTNKSRFSDFSAFSRRIYPRCLERVISIVLIRLEMEDFWCLDIINGIRLDE